VMPQTREHLAIVRLLAVQRLVVALTKVDLVEPEWLSLVRDEVAETLDATPYAGAPVVATSARTGQGIESLRTLLLEQGASAEGGDPLDLTALPIDRAFSVRGTGTVVTGTLWSGRLRVGERVRLLPEGLQGRVRGLQVHGAEVDEAHAGARTAVALTGEGIDLDHVRRGQTLVTDAGWPASQMLTVRFSLLGDTDWELAHNQRVRVHLGTAEVMARCVLWEPRPLGPGGVAWGQLRLEEPVAARARQRIVLRSYSPVQTIGGAEVVEPLPPKRRGADTTLEATFRATLEGDAVAAVESVAARAGWAGTPAALLAVTTGLAPEAVESAVGSLEGAGAVRTPQGRLVPADLADETRRLLLDRVDRTHAAEPFRPGTPVDVLRDALAEDAAEGLADTVLTALVAERVLVSDRGVVARTGFEPTLTSEQQALEERLARHYRDADLQPPTVPDLPEPIRADPAFWALVRRLEESGRLVSLDEGLFVWGEALDRARRAVREQLGGREGLGPADFRDAVPVSRRYLLPILAHFDRTGVTVRTDDGRAVPP
jgi:selenocysteine-specific elongation factor